MRLAPAAGAIVVSCVLISSSLSAAPLLTSDGPPVEVTLEGGATIGETFGIDGPAVVLDGREGSYAHYAAPEVEQLRNFRAQVRVRLDEVRAGTVAMGWPGAFLIYFNGEGKPWLVIDTPDRRHAFTADDAVTPTLWYDIDVEYRADDFGVLRVNGESVAVFKGRGALTPQGDRIMLGRYDWEEEGEARVQWMHGAVAEPQLTLLPDDDRAELDTEGMRNGLNVSFGDTIVIGEGWRALTKPEHIPPFIEEAKRFGVTEVYLRCSSLLIQEFYEKRMDEDHWYMSALANVEGDMHAAMIEACHAAGIDVLAYASIFDEGSPTTVRYGNTPFIWQSQFTIDHPEYLRVSRDGETRHWGVLCYAYPEAREYMAGKFQWLLDNWDFDGAYICTRTHSEPAKFADQFGYNQPIVEEFQRRYGADIRSEEFSRPRWWALQGEGLTELLREMRAALGERRIVLAMPRSDHIGPPYGNMLLDWRTWAQEGLVDALVLGVISGGWHYPDSMDRPGYVQSQQDNVGMREVEFDLGEWFGPWCAEYGVDVLLSRGGFPSDREKEQLEYPGMAGYMLHFAPK